MKKILVLFICCFLSGVAWAGCVLWVSQDTCPQKECPSGSIMGDDGICYPCDSEKNIDISCLTTVWNKDAQSICPNRFTEVGCGYASRLACFDLSESDMNRLKMKLKVLSILNPFRRSVTGTGHGCEMVDYEDHTCSRPCVFY